jgi:hypothetical protein
MWGSKVFPAEHKIYRFRRFHESFLPIIDGDPLLPAEKWMNEYFGSMEYRFRANGSATGERSFALTRM